MQKTKTRHRPRVGRTRENTPEGMAWVYRVTCPCHAPFGGHFAKKDAAAERLAHLADVAPPVADRCRDPRAHRCQPHDHCPLCAGQMTLPGFEIPAVPAPRSEES